jgi:hypothetical protein
VVFKKVVRLRGVLVLAVLAAAAFSLLRPKQATLRPKAAAHSRVDLMINYLGSENFLNIWLNAFGGGKRVGPALALRSFVSERTLPAKEVFVRTVVRFSCRWRGEES